jgi:hypothetical protein
VPRLPEYSVTIRPGRAIDQWVTSGATATFAGIKRHSDFNKRLQPAVISASVEANQLMNLGYYVA